MNRTGTGAGAASMRGRICLITGATGGMGRVIATELVRRGATVVLVARSQATGDAVAAEVMHTTGNPAVEVLVAELSDQSAIRRLAEEFRARHDRLHVLVNNAGAHFRERAVSVDGHEMHLAVNHLSWFLLTNLLLEHLKAGAPSRIVNVGSQAMADSRQVKIGRRPRPVTLHLDDLQSERTFDDPMAVYGRSKLAMVMCSYVLARRLEGSGVTINAVHPGLAGTGIIAAIAPRALQPALGLVKRFLLTPEEGAQAALRLATDPHLATTTGKYFNKQVEAASPDIAYDTDLQERLWNASATLVGLTDRPVDVLDTNSAPR